jgi:hypothetical protein
LDSGCLQGRGEIVGAQVVERQLGVGNRDDGISRAVRGDRQEQDVAIETHARGDPL